MKYSDNPLNDFYSYEDDIEREESCLPTCCYCEEKIHDESYYRIDGKNYCLNCLETYFKEWTM